MKQSSGFGGDMVLVCVTAFKGHHKIQDRWENKEYVVEKQPYPNVPVYVVCPRDGEGHSWTLHRNYLLPINSNIGQGEEDAIEADPTGPTATGTQADHWAKTGSLPEALATVPTKASAPAKTPPSTTAKEGHHTVAKEAPLHTGIK